MLITTNACLLLVVFFSKKEWDLTWIIFNGMAMNYLNQRKI